MLNQFEKIQEIKNEVKEKVLGRIKRESLNQKTDEMMIRVKIEQMLQSVLKIRVDGVLDEGLRRGIIEEVVNEIFGLGPLDRLIHDSSVWEIMVNGPREVYVEREGRLDKTDIVFTDEEDLLFYIERILSPAGRRISELEPYIDAHLPDGSRVNVVRSPVAANGPVLTLRKANHSILGIQDLISRGTLNEEVARFLEACVKNRLNIIMAGGPGCGKTTMMNILANYIPEQERLVTIEDTLELRIHQNKHRVALQTRPATIEGRGQILIRDLLRNALHMRPDRVIIGEVRGEEALDMLQSMNIGRSGSMTTLHANSCMDALLRLETMAMMGSANVSTRLIQRQIISAIDLVIMMDREISGHRRIVAISEVAKHEPEYMLSDIYVSKQNQQAAGRWDLVPTGHRPVFLDRFVDFIF